MLIFFSSVDNFFISDSLKSPKSPSPPNDLLVTAGFNLQIYHRLNPKKDHPKKTFSRFQVKPSNASVTKIAFRIKSILEHGDVMVL